jgi:outer membrane cobalamin receptor
MTRTTIALLALWLSFGGRGLAQTPATAEPAPQDTSSAEKPPEPAFSETVVVTASRLPQMPSETPATMTVLTLHEIERSSARSLDELLRTVPGFTLLRQSPGVASQPSTRATSVRGLGGGNSRTLALVDGVPLNDPFAGIVYWSRIPIDNIERIEIVKSGASGAWGNLALGGVINVITKSPQTKPAVFFSAEGGNEKTGNVTAGVRQSVGPWSGSLTGSFFRTDGYVAVRPDLAGPIDRTITDKNGSLDGRLRYQPSEQTVWDVGGNFFNERQRFGTPLSVSGTKIGSVNGRGTWQTSDGSRWTVAGYVSRQNSTNATSTIATDRRSETPATNQFDVPATAIGSNLQWSKSLTSTQLVSIGADTQWIDGETNEDFNFLGGVLTRRRRSAGRQLFTGVYAEDLVQLASRWRLVAGARVDSWQAADGFRRETDIPSQTILRDDVYADRNEVTVNPSLGVVFMASKHLSVRGSAYRGFRAPTSVELYRPFRARGNVVTESNALLNPERLTGGEGGVDITVGGLRVRETAFWDDLSDAITTRTIAEAGGVARNIAPCGVVPAGGVCRQRQNIGRIRSRGLESELHFRARAGWGLGATYLFDPSRVVDNPAEPLLVGRFNKLSPTHQLVVTADYEHLKWITVSVIVRAIGSSFEDDVNSLELHRFAVTDVRISRPLSQQAELFVSFQNAADRIYEISRAADGTVGIGAPRLIHGGVRLHF